MLVDGGSRDGTIEIARRVPAVTALVSPRGRATQMNAGARAAHGRVLLFLHADTWLPDGALAAVGAALADPAVVTRARSAATRPRRFRRLVSSMSSMSGIAAKPPRLSKTSRRTKMA